MKHTVIKCTTCGAPMIFLRTVAGKTMPVDASTVADGDQLYDSTKHGSHFKTCTDPNRHSHKGKQHGRRT